MIAQDIGFTRHFLKERRIHDYDRLKKMSCGTNGQARAGVIHEISGLEKTQTRPDQRGDDLATTKARQADLHDQLRELAAADSGDAVARAQLAALQAESKALKAHLEMLRLEGVSQPDRKKLLNLAFKKDRAALSLQQRFVEELQQQLSEKRRDVAEQAQQHTSEVASSYADQHPLLRTAATENAEFGDQLSALSRQIDAINKISERENRRQVIIETTLSTITDFDNKELVIPNQKLITEPLINWTLSNPITRLTFNTGVAYGSDPEQVQALVLESVKANDKVLEEPKPSVFFTGFGDNALNFEARVFVSDRVYRMPVTSEVYTALNKVLTDNGIEIPFPQRDLHLRGVDTDISAPDPRQGDNGTD